MNWQACTMKSTRLASLATILALTDMPQQKCPPLKCLASSNGRSKTWLLILHDDAIRGDDGTEGTPDVVKLRHPRTGAGTTFLFSRNNSVVQEVFSLSDKRSWFVNDSVRGNGKMYFSTPVDATFLILPYLKKSKEEDRTVPLEDLLIDGVFPDTSRLLRSRAINSLDLLADRKGPKDLNAWTFNEGKTIRWLHKKTENVAEVLKKKQINIGGSATSKNFVKSAREASSDFDKESYLKYAHSLVSEYLTDDLSSKLSSSLGLLEESPEKKKGSKRKSSTIEEQENVKKRKPKEEQVDRVNIEKTKNQSNKEKQMVKAASGSKSIMSFFKKK